MTPRPPSLLYPAIADLQPGDLLFAKKPGDRVIAFRESEVGNTPPSEVHVKMGLSEAHLQMTVGQLLTSTRAEDAQVRLTVGLWRTRILFLLAPIDDGSTHAGLTMIDEFLVPQMLQWGQRLFDALAGTAGRWFDGLGLTVSHVAMAFEQDGQWYVMEAGCTDYSHYRVCISPYHDDDDSNRAKGQARGWAKRRADLGQGVWSARRRGLEAAHMPAIVDHCKNFLSVPYGILEPGMMGNPDRMYCAELLQRGFQQVDLDLDENQTWEWVLTQLGAAFPWPFQAERLTGLFPLLSPKMIYKASYMEEAFKPADHAGRDLLFV